MVASEVRLGVVGCGRAAGIHLDRLRKRPEVRVVGLTDASPDAARRLAASAGSPELPVFADLKELIAAGNPTAVAIFTPHKAHYRPAMEAVQSGCHVFIEKPLSTNVQEAVDIVNVARARGRIVAVGHQFRLAPSLIEARRRLAAGEIGRPRLVTAVMARPWLAEHGGPEESWRLDPKVSGGGILADAGDHLLDALLWSVGRTAVEVAAVQDRLTPNLDVVTAAAIRLSGDLPATFALSAVSPGGTFELAFYGESGRLVATDRSLRVETDAGAAEFPAAAAAETIDGDFLAAVAGTRLPCCPAADAVETVRLLEAVARSAASGQSVRLS